MPGGFCKNYESDLRIEKQSDQGPWGGSRALFWKSKRKGYFTRQNLIALTSSNGWSLVDSVKYQDEPMNNEKASITIMLGPFEPASGNDFLWEDFPRWTKAELTLYSFKTGWLFIDPATNSSTEIDGFATISADGSELTVYHLWGE